ncbi:Abi family protein [Actinomyces weissii]|uniref:Uncharacterized protein n=1 Tax=Actinomyces weissii TaxID=675090 RepID=A0A7T7MAM3_9ACTO|nr:hypothetical protein [Actinomyces weissii]QQM67412.1 hypothetical protein JG540_00395 [Actinomyces weissii]
MKPNVKPFCTYAEQVTIFQSRGMHIEDPDRAQKQLETVNYYRLSGYRHTMRQIDPDTGRSLNISKPGSSFSLTEPFSSGLVVEVEDDEYYGDNYGGGQADFSQGLETFEWSLGSFGGGV